VGRRKAAGPATSKVNGPHAFSQAAKPRAREAIPSESAIQVLAVYDGQTCLDFLLACGKQRFEPFDADDKTLSTFADLKTATGAISAKVAL
jgi:hypothetical protein